MRNFWIVILLLLVVTSLGFVLVGFQVRQTESALVTRFGKPVRPITEPGLYFKLPAPIERVHKFDSRSRLYEPQEGFLEETTTAGGEPIIVSSYVVWRISDPLQFLVSVRDSKGAEENLKSLLRNAQNAVVGRHYFSELVNTDRDKIRFEQIEQEMQGEMAPLAAANYGMEIRAVGLRRLMVSEKVTENVFDRMRADRDRRTKAILAAGAAEADRSQGDAQAKEKELLAIADAQAEAIRGAGDAEAAKYYKMLEADPELAMFLRDIEALRTILKERSTIVLGTDIEPMRLLKQIPDLQNRQSGQGSAGEGK